MIGDDAIGLVESEVVLSQVCLNFEGASAFIFLEGVTYSATVVSGEVLNYFKQSMSTVSMQRCQLPYAFGAVTILGWTPAQT